MLAWVLLGFLGGTLVGWGYFAGLWWTVQRTQAVARPGLLLLISFLLRAAAVGLAALLALRLGPVTLVTGLLGFLLVRGFMLRRRAPRASRRRLPE